jgi:hypothetical protein
MQPKYAMMRCKLIEEGDLNIQLYMLVSFNVKIDIFLQRYIRYKIFQNKRERGGRGLIYFFAILR